MNDTGWFKNSIIYQILIDRYAGVDPTKESNKPIFTGGNLRGIIEKLPYLRELGINTIWISPFYKTSAYHGYHITDFFDVEPNFGTLSDLKELIDLIHLNDMRIIADFVPNHCSKEHPFFKDAKSNQDSEYKNWFYFTRWPDEYLCFLSVRELPKLNLENPETKNHIINAAKHWLNTGLDGFRIDHVIGPTHKFWMDFKSEIKKSFPNTILIGEAWMKGIRFNELKTINVNHKFLRWLSGDSSDYLLGEYNGQLDGALDFRFQELIRDYVASEKLSKKEFFEKIENHYKKFPKDYFLPNFLDNHDMNRFLFECNNNKEKLKKSAEIQFSISQPPIIYYGSEIGLTQDKSIWNIQSYGDLQARQPMDWSKKNYELFDFYKKLIKEKKNLN